MCSEVQRIENDADYVVLGTSRDYDFADTQVKPPIMHPYLKILAIFAEILASSPLIIDSIIEDY